MEVYEISEAIRSARIKNGMTQETLAFGICSVSTLSKIENGRRKPQMGLIEALMDRMGEPTHLCIVYVSQHELEKRRIRERMARAMLLGDMELLQQTASAYQDLVRKRKQMDQQWIDLANVVLQWWNGAKLPETEQKLTDILRQSCQGYREKWDREMLYTHCEILIFQMLIQCRMKRGDYDWGIASLQGMCHYLKRGSNVVWKERMLISVYGMLSESYFVTGQYPSSAKYSAKGLTISMNADYYRFAPMLLNILAACEAKLGDTSESHQAESCSKLLDAFMTSQNYLSKFVK